MTTRLTPDQLDRAADALRAGRLVAFPTETVYGLGANACDVDAVARIFEAKARPHFDPLIVHVADLHSAKRCAAHWPEAAQRLGEAFWPGPLTIVVEKVVEEGQHSGSDAAATPIPDLVTSGLPTVAVRVPAHPVARRLIEAAGVPVAAPSANRFGSVSPTCADHVLSELAGDQLAYVVDGGPCETGVESTVVSAVSEAGPTVLRLGGLAVEDIERVIGPVLVATGGGDESVAVEAGRQSPGMLARHYAPGAAVTVAADALAAARDATSRAGVLLFQPRPGIEAVDVVQAVEVLSPTGDLKEAAANLFAALRRLDAAGVRQIFAEPAPEEGLGRAINDRLRRAAASADG